MLAVSGLKCVRSVPRSVCGTPQLQLQTQVNSSALCISARSYRSLSWTAPRRRATAVASVTPFPACVSAAHAPAQCRSLSSGSGAASVLVVADHDNAALNPGTANAVSAAAQLGEVTVLVAGNSCSAVADEVASLAGVSRVLVAESPALEHGIAENITAVVAELQGNHSFSHIVTVSNAFGKNFMPRLGAELDVQPLSDVISIESADTFVRPVYAGNALCTVQSTDAVKLLTVRSTAFEAAAQGDSKAAIEAFSPSNPDAGLSSWLSDELSQSDRPDLTSAPVVISGGRGMKNGENFAMLEELADLLGGAVGASRAAVDAGFVPNELQVGQTGKVVAPQMYMAVGISGAIQHLAGMKDSKTIIAVNKDAEAPIFQVADYGLVADLFKAVPELVEKVKQAKA